MLQTHLGGLIQLPTEFTFETIFTQKLLGNGKEHITLNMKF